MFEDRHRRGVLLSILAIVTLLGLIALLLHLPGEAGARTIEIGEDQASQEGVLGDTISDAEDGDRIVVKGGPHLDGHLVIDREIVLDGEGTGGIDVGSISVTAPNVTIRGISVRLGEGGLEVEEDNWTLEGVSFLACDGGLCLDISNSTGGVISGSTFMTSAEDGIRMVDSAGIDLTGSIVNAPHVGLWINDSANISIENTRFSQSSIGVYLSLCDHVEIKRSVLDGNGWSLLGANSTDISVVDSLLLSTSSVLDNYGAYLAFDHNVTISNCTMSSNAAGISLWKTENATVRLSSIYGNLEGVWATGSDLEITDNAIFDNIRYDLNVSDSAALVDENYWGTEDAEEVERGIEGSVDPGELRASDPTPDQPPQMVGTVPDLVSREDAFAEIIYDLGRNFEDDTWYAGAYGLGTSRVMFTLESHSDPDNVTVLVDRTGSCTGTCPSEQGNLMVTTIPNWYGQVDIRVRAHDWRGKSVLSNEFTISFPPSNDLPYITVEDHPKYSTVELEAGETMDFTISVQDDSERTWVEYRLDQGEWERMDREILCSGENESLYSNLPVCGEVIHEFEPPGDLEEGRHTLSFRACDQDHCSDGSSTGRYNIDIDYEMGEGMAYSERGMGLALVLLVLLMVTWAVVGGLRSSGSDHEDGIPDQEGDRSMGGGAEEE